MELIYRFDPHRPIVINRPGDAAAAAAALLAGNQRFVKFVSSLQSATMGEAADEPLVVPIDLVSLGLPLIAGVELDQRPFALVLGCSDARVPVESVFDLGFNDLFVVRIAGNVLGAECLGSFDYAVRHLGDTLKLVVVLGHHGCGAVTAAVDTYLEPSDYGGIAFTHALRSLVDRIMIAVRGSAQALNRVVPVEKRKQPGYRTALVETSVYLNAAITAFDLAREAVALERGGVQVMYGVYDLRSMLIRSAPPAQGDSGQRGVGLAPAPRSAEDFARLGREIVDSVVGTTSFE